jgi:outer membrane protein
MNSTFVFAAALVAGFVPMAAVAQATPAVPQQSSPAAAQQAAPAESAAPQAAAQAPSAPSAFPAKVALIAFEQAVIATNEGQRTLQDVQKKYAPQKAKLDALASDIDAMKKQLQSAPATLSDQERATRLKAIDAKDKQYQRDAEEASTSYNAEIQEALSKVMQKVNVVVQNYVKKNGYTLLLDVGGQQSPVMWASADPNADITEAVVAAYNASSGVTAPPPAAPTTTTHPKPAATTPKAAPKAPAAGK